MKSILLITLSLASLLNLSAQQTAKGYVFEDINNNGKKERKGYRKCCRVKWN